MTEYEEVLRSTVLPELEKGRLGWDKPHTEAVVDYLKSIISNSPDLKLDYDVLIIAAYAHDWGYSGLFKDGIPLQLDEVNNAKEAHVIYGVEKLGKLLLTAPFSFLSQRQKDRALHLVKIHDSLEQIGEIDEVVLMEADTLGGLDVDRVKPSFDKKSNDKYMQVVREKRYPLFKTEYGRIQFERLFILRNKYYANID